MTRPDIDTYFMQIALAVRARADCLGRRVGAVLVRDRHIIATGYNGTVAGATNCSEGGCHRCSHPEIYQPGQGYDHCVCSHAEENAVAMAAKFGISVLGATCYTTTRPCFGCSKLMLQAGVKTVHYQDEWLPQDVASALHYRDLQRMFPGGVHRLP